MRRLLATVSFATLCLAPAVAIADPAPLYGAVVVYAAPLDRDTPSGAAFSAASAKDVLDLAVEQCKAHTVTEQWANCAPDRWINTGQNLLVATVCTARDGDGKPRRVLEFLKDGVTATDEEIREAVQRNVGPIEDGGCSKVAVFDRTRPGDTNLEDVQTARSVAKDKPH